MHSNNPSVKVNGDVIRGNAETEKKWDFSSFFKGFGDYFKSADVGSHSRGNLNKVSGKSCSQVSNVLDSKKTDSRSIKQYNIHLADRELRRPELHSPAEGPSGSSQWSHVTHTKTREDNLHNIKRTVQTVSASSYLGKAQELNYSTDNHNSSMDASLRLNSPLNNRSPKLLPRFHRQTLSATKATRISGLVSETADTHSGEFSSPRTLYRGVGVMPAVRLAENERLVLSEKNSAMLRKPVTVRISALTDISSPGRSPLAQRTELPQTLPSSTFDKASLFAALRDKRKRPTDRKSVV